MVDLLQLSAWRGLSVAQAAASEYQIFFEIVCRRVLVNVRFYGLSVVNDFFFHFSVSNWSRVHGTVALLFEGFLLDARDVTVL